MTKLLEINNCDECMYAPYTLCLHSSRSRKENYFIPKIGIRDDCPLENKVGTPLDLFQKFFSSTSEEKDDIDCKVMGYGNQLKYMFYVNGYYHTIAFSIESGNIIWQTIEFNGG